MFNIQLNHDINQALDPGSWDSEFHAVSLYGPMEHLASNVKNIKESLQWMGSYIKAKSVSTNPNNVKDLEGISKELWHFFSVVYESHWDGLYMDNSNTSFRNKVKSKFNPQVPKTLVSNKGKEMVKPTYVSPLFPLIPAKTPKEVNEVSKYFKKVDGPQKKLYVQTSFKSWAQALWTISWTCSRSRRCSQNYRTRKLIKYRRSSMEIIANLSSKSTWPPRAPPINKLLCP